MDISKELLEDIRKMIHAVAMENMDPEIYKVLCQKLNVVRMYYDMDLGGNDR